MDSLGYQTVSGDRTFRVAPSITVGVAAYPGDSEAVVVWSPTPRKTCLVILSIEAPHPALDFQKSTVFHHRSGFPGSGIE